MLLKLSDLSLELNLSKKFQLKSMGEIEERRNPNFLAFQMGREVSRKKRIAPSSTQLTLPTVFIEYHRKFRCLGPELPVQPDLTVVASVQADLTVVAKQI